MSDSRNDDAPPMAEPGQRTVGANVGGMASTADAGLADSLVRSTERGAEDPTGVAAGSNAVAGSGATTERADLGGKNEPGSAPGPSGGALRASTGAQGGTTSAASRGATSAQRPAEAVSGAERSADRDSSARTESEGPSRSVVPERDRLSTEPADESPLESLGESVSEVVKGPLEDPGARKPGR